MAVSDFTVKLSLDTSNFSSSMSDLNKKMGLLKSEFKANDSALKGYGDSIDQLKNKQKYLTDALKIQEEKVKSLKASYDKQVEATGENSAAAEKLGTKLNNNISYYNKLENELKQTNSQLKEAEQNVKKQESAWHKMGETIKKTGSGLDKLGGGFQKLGGFMTAKLTAPIIAGFTALTAGTQELRTNMAFLKTNTKQAGFSFDEVKGKVTDVTTIFGDMDSAVEGVSDLMASGLNHDQFTTAIDFCTDAAIRFKDTMKFEGVADGLQETLKTGQATGPFAEALDRCGVSTEKLNEDLKNCKTDTERVNLVFKAMSESGLAGTTEEFKKLNPELVANNEAMEKMKMTAADIGEKLVPMLQPLLDTTVALLDRIDAFATAHPDMFGTIVKIAGAIAVLGPALSAIGKVISGVGTAISTVAAWGGKIATFFGAGGTFMKIFGSGGTIATALGALKGLVVAHPIAAAVVAAIAAIIGAITLLWNKCDWFRNGIMGIWEWIKSHFMGIPEWLGGIWESVKTSISGFWTWITTKVSELWESIKTSFTNFWTWITGKVTGLWDSIKTSIGGFWSWLTGKVSGAIEWIKGMWDTIKNVFTVSLMAIGEALNAAWTIITLNFRFLWENLKEPIMNVWESIKKTVSDAMDYIGNVIDKVMNTIKNVWSTVWGAIKDFVSSVWEAIKSAVSSAVEAIKSAIDTALNAIKNTWNTIWGAIKEFTSSVWEAIKNAVKSAIDAVKSAIETALNAIKNTWNTIWEAIKNFVSTIWEGIKNAVKSAIDAVKNTVESVMNAIKNTWSSIWEGIKSKVEGIVNGIKSFISSAFQAIKSHIIDPIKGAYDVVVNTFNNIKSAITEKINAAKDAVKSAIDAIKGFFDFDWKLPDLKTPHFSVTGSFSLDPPSVPHFGVEWYKDGGIMTKPTMFGLDGGRPMIGGEAGAEAILPLRILFKEMKGIIREEMGTQPVNVIVNVNNEMDGKQIGKVVTYEVKKNIERSNKNYNINKGR